MKTVQNCINLLVLVPHRDTRRLLQEWSFSLFSAGLSGSWAFPWAAPLALLNRSLSSAELKTLAIALRQKNDKFSGNSPFSINISGIEPAFLYGIALNMELPANFFDSVKESVISSLPPIIGTALHQEILPENLPFPPEIKFGAAALANMSYKHLHCGEKQNNLSYEWNIDTLYWLPKTKKT